LGQETFDRGEPTTKSTGFDTEVELEARHSARLGFENVSRQILLAVYSDCDPAAQFGNFASGLDFVASVCITLADEP